MVWRMFESEFHLVIVKIKEELARNLDIGYRAGSFFVLISVFEGCENIAWETNSIPLKAFGVAGIWIYESLWNFYLVYSEEEQYP